jgi:hypothetical protein
MNELMIILFINLFDNRKSFLFYLKCLFLNIFCGWIISIITYDAISILLVIEKNLEKLII